MAFEVFARNRGRMFVSCRAGVALSDEITAWKARRQSLADARAAEMQRREEQARQCEELQALFTSAVIHEDSENRWTVEFAGLSAQQVRDLAARV
jgi:hypothetical protein